MASGDLRPHSLRSRSAEGDLRPHPLRSGSAQGPLRPHPLRSRSAEGDLRSQRSPGPRFDAHLPSGKRTLIWGAIGPPPLRSGKSHRRYGDSTKLTKDVFFLLKTRFFHNSLIQRAYAVPKREGPRGGPIHCYRGGFCIFQDAFWAAKDRGSARRGFCLATDKHLTSQEG